MKVFMTLMVIRVTSLSKNDWTIFRELKRNTHSQNIRMNENFKISSYKSSSINLNKKSSYLAAERHEKDLELSGGCSLREFFPETKFFVADVDAAVAQYSTTENNVLHRRSIRNFQF